MSIKFILDYFFIKYNTKIFNYKKPLYIVVKLPK